MFFAPLPPSLPLPSPPFTLSRDSVAKVFWRVGCLALLIDVGCAVALLGDFAAWTPSVMMSSLTWTNLAHGFRTQPTDVLTLSLSRLVVGPALIYFSATWAQAAMRGHSRREGLPAAPPRLPSTSKDLGDGYSALLSPEDKAEAEGLGGPAMEPDRPSVNVGAAANAEVMDQGRAAAKRRESPCCRSR